MDYKLSYFQFEIQISRFLRLGQWDLANLIWLERLALE